MLGVVTTATVALLACGSQADSLSAANGGSSGTASDGGSFSGDATTPPGDQDASSIGAANGIVIVHAAFFQSFRLCFENYPDIEPQPDRTVMPEANVVGVEVGSAVRIGKLDKPGGVGKVYIIDRRELRVQPNDPPKPCKKLISTPTFNGELREDLDYHVAGPLTQPLGVGRVDVLAITGCGDESRMNELKIPTSECTDWDRVKGSLAVRTLPLFPSFAANATSLPVQLVHMSAPLEAQRGSNVIDITYGSIDGGTAPLDQKVAANPTIFATSMPVTLGVDQASDAAVYGGEGFRVALRSSPNGPATVSFDQSLAEVQDLSSPKTIPTTYYLAASNYALLLLGDPRIRRNFSDGGANPAFDSRRAVHLLAVPVKDPEAEDAGSPEPVDAGPPTGDE